jgi:hypothetical protein
MLPILSGRAEGRTLIGRFLPTFDQALAMKKQKTQMQDQRLERKVSKSTKRFSLGLSPKSTFTELKNNEINTKLLSTFIVPVI